MYCSEWGYRGRLQTQPVFTRMTCSTAENTSGTKWRLKTVKQCYSLYADTHVQLNFQHQNCSLQYSKMIWRWRNSCDYYYQCWDGRCCFIFLWLRWLDHAYMFTRRKTNNSHIKLFLQLSLNFRNHHSGMNWQLFQYMFSSSHPITGKHPYTLLHAQMHTLIFSSPNSPLAHSLRTVEETLIRYSRERYFIVLLLDSKITFACILGHLYCRTLLLRKVQHKKDFQLDKVASRSVYPTRHIWNLPAGW